MLFVISTYRDKHLDFDYQRSSEKNAEIYSDNF